MKDTLDKIIDGSGLDPKLRKVLHESFAALTERQTALEYDLRTTINQEYSSQKTLMHADIHVKTALIDRRNLNNLSAWGFFDASPNVNNVYVNSDCTSNILFLNVPYNEFQNFLNKKYQSADGTEYELIPYYGYIENEKKLELLWRLYGFESSRPFSPWARRAVWARFSKPMQEKPDLNAKANGLDSYLLKNKTLVWNVEFRAGDQAAMPSLMSRSGEEAYKYRYSARDGDLALWPLPQEVYDGRLAPETLDASLTNENVILTSGQLFSSLACEKIIFHNNSCVPTHIISPLEIYSNHSFSRLPVTKGEFNRLLSSFSTKDFVASLSGQGKNSVHRYEKGHRSASYLEQQLRCGEPFNVFFSCNNPEFYVFIEDYANWVLTELERYFPIFYWRGWF